jgi:hypothetical protein
LAIIAKVSDILSSTQPTAKSLGSHFGALRDESISIKIESVYRPQMTASSRRRGRNAILVFFFVLHDYHSEVSDIAAQPVVEEVLLRLNLDVLARTVAQLIDVPSHVGKYVDNYSRTSQEILAGDEYAAAGAWTYHTRWSIDLITRPIESARLRKRTRRIPLLR